MIYLNNCSIKPTIFPDNTSQIWKLPKELLKGEFAEILWEYSHEGEIVQLDQLKQLISFKTYHLTMPYLPYARQDKPIGNENSFALWTFARLINSMNFDSVEVLDVHSAMAEDLIINFRNIPPTNFITKAIKESNPDTFGFPDKGASERYKIFQKERDLVYGEKIRNQLTGYISSYEIKNQVGNLGKVLIIDDICDGGMTFKLFTEELLKQGATEVNLYVTHGIFSKGLRTLKDSGINKIYTSKGEANEHQSTIVYRRL